MPRLAAAEAAGEGGEQHAGRGQPCANHDPLTDVPGRLDHLVLLDDERVCSQVRAEQQGGSQQHHDRVEDAGVADEFAGGLHCRVKSRQTINPKSLGL